MQTSLSRILLPALLLAGLLAGGVGAQGPAAGFRIRDEGKFFSEDAIEKAQNVIGLIKRETKEDLLIETYDSIPGSLRGRFDQEGKEKFFRHWIEERYRQEKVEGIAIL